MYRNLYHNLKFHLLNRNGIRNVKPGQMIPSNVWPMLNREQLKLKKGLMMPNNVLKKLRTVRNRQSRLWRKRKKKDVGFR